MKSRLSILFKIRRPDDFIYDQCCSTLPNFQMSVEINHVTKIERLKYSLNNQIEVLE